MKRNNLIFGILLIFVVVIGVGVVSSAFSDGHDLIAEDGNGTASGNGTEGNGTAPAGNGTASGNGTEGNGTAPAGNGTESGKELPLRVTELNLVTVLRVMVLKVTVLPLRVMVLKVMELLVTTPMELPLRVTELDQVTVLLVTTPMELLLRVTTPLLQLLKKLFLLLIK